MSIVLLLVSLPLAAVPHVPSTTPFIGALGSWQGQDQADSPVVLVAPTDAPAASTASTATATALPTAPPTDTTTNAVPTATARPTATVRVPTATATSTPPPVNFTVTPSSFPWNGCPGTPPPAVPLTLDNTKGTAAVTWQATAVETLPSSNTPWATITPATSGTVAAGKPQTITVTPDPALCQFSHNGKSWHIDITTTTANVGPFSFVYNVS